MHPSLGEASLEQHFSLITPSSWQGCLPLPLQPPSLCIRRLLPSSPYHQGEKGEISGPSAVRHNVCMCVAGTLFPPTHTLSLWPNSLPPHCNQHLTLLRRLQWLTCHGTLRWVPRFRGKKKILRARVQRGSRVRGRHPASGGNGRRCYLSIWWSGRNSYRYLRGRDAAGMHWWLKALKPDLDHLNMIWRCTV